MAPRRYNHSIAVPPENSPASSLKRQRSCESGSLPSPAQTRPKLDTEDDTLPLSASAGTQDLSQEEVTDDDLCPICHLLLYKPVTTRCNHTLCASCMAHWADVSVVSQMTVVSLDEQPETFSASEVEAKCPMCRTQTSASHNPKMDSELRIRYPRTYEERRAEEDETRPDGSSSIETLTVYI